MTDQYISTGPFTIQQQHMMEFLPGTNNMVPKKLNGIRGVHGVNLNPGVDPIKNGSKMLAGWMLISRPYLGWRSCWFRDWRLRMVNHHGSPVVLFKKRVCKWSVDGF